MNIWKFLFGGTIPCLLLLIFILSLTLTTVILGTTVLHKDVIRKQNWPNPPMTGNVTLEYLNYTDSDVSLFGTVNTTECFYYTFRNRETLDEKSEHRCEGKHQPENMTVVLPRLYNQTETYVLTVCWIWYGCYKSSEVVILGDFQNFTVF